MAGFNFKKLTKDKHKNTRSASGGENKEQNGISPSKFLHFNMNHDNGKQQSPQPSPNSSDISNSNANTNVPKPNQLPPPIPSRVHSEGTHPFDSSLQQNQMMYNSHQPRVFPTPQPFGQRNVSGATQLMQLQQKQQQQQRQQSETSNSYGEKPLPQVGSLSNQETILPQQTSPHYEASHDEIPSAPQNRPVTNPSAITTDRTTEPAVWNRIKLRNSPFPRYRHVASSYATDDDRIFVIGGLHDQSVYGDIWIIKSEDNGTKFESSTIDIAENTPPPRVGHAATLCGNAFVVFGGDTHKVNKDGLMDDDLYLFNINSYKWTIPQPVGPRPLGRYGHKISIIATTPMKTKLYLFGGQFDDTYFNNLAVFDLSSFRRPDSHWEFLKPKTFIPPPLTNHTMVSYDNKLWVFGGDTLQGLINKVFMYDPELNDWCIIDTTAADGNTENIPPPMQEHAAIMYGHLMCIVGGKDELDNYLNTVFFLNLVTFRWYRLPFLSVGIPQSRSGHSVTLLKNNKLLIMGGDKFDYARPEKFDLHTSETDMGNGTILYTLDLTTLKDLCPGIMNKVPNINLNHIETDDSVRPDTYPSTPPVNNKEFLSGQQMNTSPSSVTTNGTIPKDFNKLPELAVHNILTPHPGPENQKTPKIDGDETFDKSENTTPVTPVVATQVPSETTDMNEPIERIVTPISRENNQTFDDSDLQGEKTPEIEVAVRTPIKSEHSLNVKDSPIKLNEEVSHNLVTDDNHDESEQLADESLADLNARRLVNEEEEQAQNNISKLKHSPFTDFHNKTTDLNKEFETYPTSSLPPTISPPLAEVTQRKDNATTTSATNMIEVDRKVFDELRLELQNLKQLTKDKANEASAHILDLEKENEVLKKTIEEKTGGVTHGDELSKENDKLHDRVNVLEGLLNEKFLDLDTLNSIVRKQNETIDKLMTDENYKEKYILLKKQFQLINDENIELKEKLSQYDIEFTENIRSYSDTMQSMLNKWRENSIQIGATFQTDNSSNSPHSDIFVESPRHKNVVSKLSKQLDDLLIKSQDLSHSRDMLDAKYHQLEKRHRSLSQDLLSQQSIEDTEDTDTDVDPKTVDRVKTLQLAQEELEKFRKKNKALQDEIEQLKGSMN